MDEDQTEREQWAESEARQFDKNAVAIRESGNAWLARDLYPDNAFMAATCALKAQTWEDAARSLRQPYQIRIERERNPQRV